MLQLLADSWQSCYFQFTAEYAIVPDGTFIVPVYSRHMDSAGHYAEYVETAKSNDDFIIAKTLLVKNKTANYWIINKDFSIDNCDKINCDSLIQTHVIGPLDKDEFQKKISELKLNLKFDKN